MRKARLFGQVYNVSGLLLPFLVSVMETFPSCLATCCSELHAGFCTLLQYGRGQCGRGLTRLCSLSAGMGMNGAELKRNKVLTGECHSWFRPSYKGNVVLPRCLRLTAQPHEVSSEHSMLPLCGCGRRCWK